MLTALLFKQDREFIEVDTLPIGHWSIRFYDSREEARKYCRDGEYVISYETINPANRKREHWYGTAWVGRAWFER